MRKISTKAQKYLQKAEAEAWMALVRAHFEFVTTHGTFDNFEEYDKALGEDAKHRECLAVWTEIYEILGVYNVPIDYELHRPGFKLSRKEPKPYNY